MKKPFLTMEQLRCRFSKNVLAIALGVAILGTGCSKDDDDENTTPTPNPTTIAAVDREFIQKASLSNSAEIQLGQLAISKAMNDSVKAFGQFMVTEHTTAQNELSTLANAKSVSISTTLDSAHQAKKNQLTAATGRAFDSLYVLGQVEDHQKAQELFNKEISQGQDADVKSYANKYLPHINMHYNHVIRLKDSISKK